jgi:hypothetical protein
VAASAGSFFSAYRLDLSGLTQDITSAKRQLTDLRAFAAQPTTIGAAGGAVGAGGSGAGAGRAPAANAQAVADRNAANAALQLTSAEARLAVAQGNTTGALRTLNAGLDANTGASARATLAVQTQAARLASGRSAYQQYGDAAKAAFLGIVGPAAVVAGAIKLVGEAGDLIKLGATAQGARASFDNLAVSVGATGDALLGKLRAAAQGTVSDANLISSANSGILLTGGKLATELPRLLQIARASAQATGDDVGFVFDSLVKGIARGSPQIIDNAKITLDAEGAFKAYAASIGKTSDQLTRADQQQATLNAVLAAGTDIIAKTGGAAETNATSIARLGANWDNLKVKIGSFLGTVVAPTINALNTMANAADKASDRSDALLASATNYAAYAAAVKKADEAQRAQVHSASQAVPNQLPTLTLAQFNYAKALEATGVAAAAARAQAVALNPALIAIGQVQAVIARQSGLSTNQLDLLSNTILQLTAAGGEGAAQANSLTQAFLRGDLSARDFAAAIQQIGPALQIQATATQQAAVAAQVHSGSMDLEVQGAIQAGLAIRAAAQATADSTVQTQIDAQAKAALTSEAQLLTAQTQATANAFLAANPNIAASGAAAAAAAAGFPPLIAQLIGVTARANEARNALAAFNALAGVQALRAPTRAEATEDVTSLRTSVLKDHTAARDKQVAATVAAAAAEARLQSIQGNEIPTIQRLRDEAEALKKTRGEDSADYINKLADIALAEKRAAAGGGGGGGRGAGGGAGAKLTDQQKLNNTLLADQAKADDKAADLERDHYRTLLKIQADFEQKSLDQQHANEVSKRQGRADFYDNLTSSSKELGAKESQALSAEYESAYAKAQSIAQAGNQKLADDYLAMRQQQLNKEIEYQKARKQAADDGDKGEVARLDAIRKLQVEADAEKEKQLLAGGDPNVKARDDALAQEDTRYDEAQGKIVTASDRATQAKIVNAQSAGKAIDVENLKLKEQAAYYDRIRARTGVPSADLPTPSTGAAPADATPATTPAAGGDQVWRVFDSGVVDALNAQTAQLSADLGAVKVAVEQLGPRIRDVESAVRSANAAVR